MAGILRHSGYKAIYKEGLVANSKEGFDLKRLILLYVRRMGDEKQVDILKIRKL